MVRVRLGKDADWYEYDGDTLTVREARELKKLTGMGLKEYANGTASADVDALCFMCLHRATPRRGGGAVARPG